VTVHLAVLGMLLAGYVWLGVITLRVRALHRRLALHICKKPVMPRPAPSISVAEILEREAAITDGAGREQHQ
jgi:hypothetical protein